jgi:hypothetical protein
LVEQDDPGSVGVTHYASVRSCNAGQVSGRLVLIEHHISEARARNKDYRHRRLDVRRLTTMIGPSCDTDVLQQLSLLQPIFHHRSGNLIQPCDEFLDLFVIESVVYRTFQFNSGRLLKQSSGLDFAPQISDFLFRNLS